MTPEQNKALNELRKGMSIDERLWLARMIQAHGIEHVLRYGESYLVQMSQS